MTQYPFTDPVTRTDCILHFGSTPGVEHPDCPFRADVFPDLDSFYCTMCGHNGRISGAWFLDLLARELSAGQG